MIRNVIKILILGGLLACVSADNLLAGQEAPKQPYAHLYPKKLKKLTKHLQREDIEVSELREDIELDVDVFLIDNTKVTTEFQQEIRRFRAGTILVKADQKSEDKVKINPRSEHQKEKENTETLRATQTEQTSSGCPAQRIRSDYTWIRPVFRR